MNEIDDQGFIIHPHENTVTIMGPTVWGTLHGAYEFLEHYVDVRWLMPGPNGEDVPQLTDLLVLKETVIDEPDFTFRELSPAYSSPEAPGERQPLNMWAQRNKLQSAINVPIVFMHNLFRVFPQEKYGATHPEFYPEGRPPAAGVTVQWQPCFTAEGSVDVAVAEIIAHFDEFPGRPSFSLGVNDSGGYCEENPSHPHYPNKINSIGLVDMSDIYYSWVNEVVERVLEVYPDKWFGLLAYQNVMDPPDFSLHPRVVPFITKDRMTWIDDEVREAGFSQMEAWKQVTDNAAWYDYLYGVQYYVPRVYPHLMAENYKLAKENGVFGHFAEMYENAGDGPKAWISARLQWDADQSVEELLEEWYVRAVGPEAASDLAAYYAIWEQFWTERIKGFSWFENRKWSTYLWFPDALYLTPSERSPPLQA